MDFGSIYEISATGMDYQRLRLETIALNMANANTTRVAGGTLYQPLEVVARGDNFDRIYAGQLAGVQDIAVVPKVTEPKLVFDPSHPDANAQGYVEMPDINPVDEMTSLMLATRAYEANVRVLNAAKTMALRALEIGE